MPKIKNLAILTSFISFMNFVPNIRALPFFLVGLNKQNHFLILISASFMPDQKYC